MTSFDYSTAEDFKSTAFGTYLLNIVDKLHLPIPSIKGRQLKKFNKGLWAIQVHQPGRETAPVTEDIQFKRLHEDQDRGLNTVMQELIGRLCGRHHPELKGHYLYFIGRRGEDGEPLEFHVEAKKTVRPVRLYYQDVEILLNNLDCARTNEVLSNDELRAQLKEKDKIFQEQEERIKDMEKKFEKQEKKFKNQEKRVQEKNKKIRELKDELESNDFELDADHVVMERLRSEKRALEEKVNALATEVEDYKEGFASAGLALEEEEVDMEED